MDELCLSSDEKVLVDAVNAFREAHGLQAVALSRALCYVADVHAKDLYFNYDERSGKSMHSWSHKGRWKGCSYENPRTDGRCMHNKPSELTDYKGLGFELAYYDNTGSAGMNAYEAWIRHEKNRAFLLNEGTYLSFDWNAVGIKIFKGYVLLWFGTTVDVSAPIVVCGQAEPVGQDVVPAVESKENPVFYYVVVASYSSEKDALKDKLRWEKRFFEPLKVIQGRGRYRLAVGAYNDNEAAKKALRRIKKTVKDAWVISL